MPKWLQFTLMIAFLLSVMVSAIWALASMHLSVKRRWHAIVQALGLSLVPLGPLRVAYEDARGRYLGFAVSLVHLGGRRGQRVLVKLYWGQAMEEGRLTQAKALYRGRPATKEVTWTPDFASLDTSFDLDSVCAALDTLRALAVELGFSPTDAADA